MFCRWIRCTVRCIGRPRSVATTGNKMAATGQDVSKGLEGHPKCADVYVCPLARKRNCMFAALPYNISSTYHRYGAFWIDDTITFYVDDFNYTSISSVASKFPQKPFYFILNTAIGGPGSWPGPVNSSTIWPQYFTVDYVTHWHWA